MELPDLIKKEREHFSEFVAPLDKYFTQWSNPQIYDEYTKINAIQKVFLYYALLLRIASLKRVLLTPHSISFTIDKRYIF